MAINTGKVISGGLAAGLVMNVLDFVINNYLLKSQMEAAMNALNPSLMGNMTGTSTMVTFIAMDFLFGILLVWTYAAMRPRFGANARGGAIAATQVWLIACITYAFQAAMGMFTWNFFAIASIAFLVNLQLSMYVGAMLYSET